MMRTSLADLYSSEENYKLLADRYRAEIRAMQRECDATGLPRTCQRVEQLNADLQAILGQMSNQLTTSPVPSAGEPSVLAQQAKLLVLTDSLEADRKSLNAKYDDQQLVTGSFKAHYLAWSLGAMVVIGFLLKKA